MPLTCPRGSLKLVYPNDVTLILPGDISASQLEQYINITV